MNIMNQNEKELEFEKYLEEIESDKYQWVDKDLHKNPTPLEKAKFDACQNSLNYKLQNELSAEASANKIGISKSETQEILFCWIENFTLDRLFNYNNLLFKNHLEINFIDKLEA